MGKGLRIVVFGGGDIGTLNQASADQDDQSTSWTEVLCRELDCESYLSYIPRSNETGGSTVSNVAYETTLNHTLTSRNITSGPAFDYSWLSTQYPTPFHLPDLQQQVGAFLAHEPAAHPTQETIWVFDFGFWDIWRLSAFPQDVSFPLIEVLASLVFQEIDLLYQASRAGGETNPDSKRSARWRAKQRLPTSTNSTSINRPFRVIIPRLFDVSLTLGFRTARFQAPHPHAQADEMRNAAYLTRHWDDWMDEMTERWLALNMPRVGLTYGTDLDNDHESDPMLLGISSRREVINPNMPKYLLGLIADRQLKDSGLEDGTGMGTMPADEAFDVVDEACLQPNTTAAAASGATLDVVYCTEAEAYLFWDSFTVGPRAVRNIGRRAKDLFERHVEVGAPWLKKAQVHYSD